MPAMPFRPVVIERKTLTKTPGQGKLYPNNSFLIPSSSFDAATNALVIPS